MRETPLAAIEIEMQLIPGFTPRACGTFRSQQKYVNPNPILYEESLGLFLKEIEIQAFALRVQRIIEVASNLGESEVNQMLFRNAEHKKRFQSICKSGLFLKLEESYGYAAAIFLLSADAFVWSNPTRSDGDNILHLVNKYMDAYMKNPDNLALKAKAEKYAKITAKTIITSSGEDVSGYGQNAFFYDAAEGLLTSVILLIAEYCPPEKRHIISVFKMIQDLLAPSPVKNKSQFQLLMNKLPADHKARWFAGAALNTADQAMASVLSTAMSRLNAFLDSEMEQILCFDSSLDTETFCKEKSAIFIVLPEEDTTKYFMVSLFLQQLYREMLTVADEYGGKLPNRVMIFADEIGTIPKIQSMEMMFSAGRSRRISMVPIIQSFAQLQKNYGKEGSAIIIDNCQGAKRS